MIGHRVARGMAVAGIAAAALLSAVASAAVPAAPIPGTIETIAGGGADPDADGVPATDASLSFMLGLAVNRDGDVFISDVTTCSIRKISHGIMTRVVGTGACSSLQYPEGAGDGGPALDAMLSRPEGLAFDSAGNLYIADSFHCEVRKVDAQTNMISAFAGTGPYCSSRSGDGGPAADASILFPSGLAIDRFDNVYIGEVQDCSVRKVTGGIISTVAGDGSHCGYTGDGGPAVDALLTAPAGLAVDGGGVLYIAGGGRIRQVRDGIIATIAGTDLFYDHVSPDGPALEMRLGWMQGMAVDGAGGLLIADSDNCVVRRLKDGMLTVLAGAPQIIYGSFVPACGHTGDGGSATSAEIGSPVGVGADSAGNVYFAEIHEEGPGPASVRVVYGAVPPAPAPPRAPVRTATPTSAPTRTAEATGTSVLATPTIPPPPAIAEPPRAPVAHPDGDRAGAIVAPGTGVGASRDSRLSPMLASLAAIMLVAGAGAVALAVKRR